MKIVTAVVNNPDFIEIQYNTLKKYFKGEYEFIVFNDAKSFPDFTNGGDTTIKQQIQDVCSKLNIKCINIPNEKHIDMALPCIRCADSMNFILEYQKQNPDKYLLLDSDMFLIDEFDIETYTKYHCAVVLQNRNDATIHYFWNGIYYMDFTKMRNIDLLNWDCCNDCDVGGSMQEWLKLQMGDSPIPNRDDNRWKNETCHTDTIYFINHISSLRWSLSELPANITNEKLIQFFLNDRRNENGKLFCEIYDNVFLHYRAGGNWIGEGLDFHKNQTKCLKDALL
jgi:hypothetical protein